MHRRGGRSAWETVALVVVAWCLLTGLTSWAEAAPTVTLTQAVHFAASDGSDVVAEAGTYQVDAAESRLTLSTEGRAPLLLDAKPTTHSEKIDAELAVTVPSEDPDVLHVVLLQPNGQALDAPGSLSGTRSRDIAMMLATPPQIQFAIQAQGYKPMLGPAMVGGVTGPTSGTVEIPGRYSAPTASLTMVANAIKLQYKSLNTVLAVLPGLSLLTPVEITVEYLSPASPRQTITQQYVPETGNRFVRQDLVGDGNPRTQIMNIKLIERPSAGSGAQFTMNWKVDLDPLYNVTIGALDFKLVNDCDFAYRSEIRIGWLFPDRGTGSMAGSTRAGQIYTGINVPQFQWKRTQVSAKSNLVRPYTAFTETDVTSDRPPSLPGPGEPLQPLIPGTSGVVIERKKAQGQDCRAEFKYSITHTLYVDPLLLQPALPPSIVLDNREPSVLRAGTWCRSSATVGVFGPDSEWSCDNNTGLRFRWTPSILESRQYDVYVWFPNNQIRSTTVPYTVHHANGDTVKYFNQQTGGGIWALHGRYRLAAGTSNYVEVSNANGKAGADAVQFRPVP